MMDTNTHTTQEHNHTQKKFDITSPLKKKKEKNAVIG